VSSTGSLFLFAVYDSFAIKFEMKQHNPPENH
jgi:hypothetical protein